MHLLAEISAKRENFFEAAGALAECRASLRDTFDAITALRHHVRPFWIHIVRLPCNWCCRQSC